MSTWTKEARKFSVIKGLDANAEWLLQEDAGKSLFLREGLGAVPHQRTTRRYDAQENQEGTKSEAEDEPPFSFMLTPTAQDEGEKLLAALDIIADFGRRYSKENQDFDSRFNMTLADRERLSRGQAAGAICNSDFMDLLLAETEDRTVNKAIHFFAETEKAMRLSSAMPISAAPPIDAKPFAPPGDLAETLDGLFPADSVVIGVIDDGFAIAHPRLRLSPTATRVASFWDQEVPFDFTAMTVPFGRELLKTDFRGMPGLDDILAGYNGPLAEIYDTNALRFFYPKKRNMMPRNRSHGTAVLDLVAGEDMGNGADRPVVAVKLPRASVLDTSGEHLDEFILKGIQHILKRAEMITGEDNPRVIIVCSYGYFGGPLDGSSQLERAMDQIIQDRDGRVQIILPSGNGRLERAHAVRSDGRSVGDVRTVKWRSPAGDRTPSVMEIWSDVIVGPPDAPTVKLAVETPYGLSSAALEFTDSNLTEKLVLRKSLTPGDPPKIIAEVVCDHPPLHPGRRRFMIWLSPTALPPPDVTDQPALSPSGVWTVRVETLAPRTTDLSVWIRRDDSLEGFPMLGRQSSIERDAPQEGPIPLNQEQWDRWEGYGTADVNGTINTIATGQFPVVASGFGAFNERAARNAAGGPLAEMAVGAPAKPGNPTNRKVGPDCLAPSQVSALRGIKAANFFGGAKVSVTGTSYAAPLVGYWLTRLYKTKTKIDGPARTRAAAKESGKDMLKAWKPNISRGAGRFLTPKMIRRTFRMDGNS